MGKNIQLHIPEPCHENWNKMTPVEKGRFCGSCQKQVVDFTNMKDEQLVAFFKRKTAGSVCGRFMQDQLDRSMQIPRKRIPWVRYFFQFALPAFLLSKKASAQGQVRILTGDTIVTPAALKIDAANKGVNIHQQEKVINGRVVDDSGEGISYASIFIKGTTIGMASDSMGKFSLKYSGNEKDIILVSSCIGFKEVETLVNLDEIDRSVTTALPSDNMLKEVIVVAKPGMMLKGMVVGGAFGVMVRTSFIDTVWSKFFPVRQTSNIYPNPVKANSQLNIRTGNWENGMHLFQLCAVNGQKVVAKELGVEKNGGVVKIDIPAVAAGAYFLQIINKQTGKRTTEKIIIE